MGKYLRDVVLSCKEPDPNFNFKLQTNFLERLYLDCLPKAFTGGTSKVIVEACRKVPEKSLETMLDVLRIYRYFDFTAYFAAEKEARKRMALECLEGGLLEVASICGWDTSPLLQAYKGVLDKNFVCWRPWSKLVTSPDRKLKAQAWCNYDSDKAEIFILIFRRKELVSKELITTVKPGDVWIRQAVSKLEWVSSEKAKLTPKSDEEMFGSART